MKKPWTEEEIKLLRDTYESVDTAHIAAQLGRSAKAIYQMARVLAIKKNEGYLKNRVYNIDPETGVKHRFKKGDSPWNKGIRWIAGGRSAETRFSPGNLPHNTRKDGHITRRSDGYLYIRVSLRQWQLLHRWLYEKCMYVKLTPEDVIKFKNGDPTDVRIENLYRTDRKGNMIENSVHNYPPEVVALVQTLGVLKRTINGRNHKSNSATSHTNQ